MEQVTTYPSVKTHTSYFTDENGYLILPNTLKIGRYRIEEVYAPKGYVLNHNTFEVDVDTNTAYQMDDTSGDALSPIKYQARYYANTAFSSRPVIAYAETGVTP